MKGRILRFTIIAICSAFLYQQRWKMIQSILCIFFILQLTKKNPKTLEWILRLFKKESFLVD